MNGIDKIREMVMDICRDVINDHALESWQLEEWLDENPKWVELRKYINGDDVEFDMDMTVRDLKVILNRIDDDMKVIIPVLDQADNIRIHGFRHVRTAGILTHEYEEKPALCLSAPGNGMDMYSQLEYNHMNSTVVCQQGLF